MARHTLKSAVYLFLFGALCSVPAMAGSIPIVSVDPLSSSVSLGSNFSLNINIANVSDLYAFQFDIGFGPNVLQATSVIEGAFLPSGGFTFFIPGTIDNNAGAITFIADTLLGPGPGVNGSGTLAILGFKASGVGTSTIDISNLILLDSNLNEIDASIEDGMVTVTGPVPEPNAIFIVGFGLAWLMGAIKLKLKT